MEFVGAERASRRHQLRLSPRWFIEVARGKKLYEGRRHTDKFAPGDTLVFRNGTEFVSTTVLDVLHYTSFEEALRTLPLQEVLPGASSVEEGVEIYKQYVSLATQEREGITMIRVDKNG